MRFLKTIRPLMALGLLAVPLALAACGSNYGPGPMPSGYVHQSKIYKAAPGPNPLYMDPERFATQKREATRYHPPGTGPANQAFNNAHAQSGGNWDNAAQDLVSRLINTLGRPTEQVFVVPGAYPALEDSLHRALSGQNIAVTQARGQGPFTVEYIVSPIANSSMVSITLLSVGKAVEEVSGIYDIGMLGGDSFGAVRGDSLDGAAAAYVPANPPSDVMAPLPILPVPHSYNQ